MRTATCAGALILALAAACGGPAGPRETNPDGAVADDDAGADNDPTDSGNSVVAVDAGNRGSDGGSDDADGGLVGADDGGGGGGNGGHGGGNKDGGDDVPDAGADGGFCYYFCPGPADAGTGPADAGTDPADGGSGSTDAGVDAGPNAHTPGGLGAGLWPIAPLTVYGTAQGLLEAPISASSDEAQDIWAVTSRALYLLRPGDRTFRRYTVHDGLHVGPGYTEAPDFTLVEGGGPGECFVGYYAHDTHDPAGTKPQFAHTIHDPMAHMGKMDQVLLKPDGTLEVRRYDLHNSNSSFFYETRTIMSMVYDHFFHPGELFVGSNHGITRILPAKWRLPANKRELGFPISVEREWYADHVHPWVCQGGPCSRGFASTFGDWFGLAFGPDGRLWMGGLTTAGAIGWRTELHEWVQSWAGHNPFVPGMGDPYPGNAPVFNPPLEGDPVNIRAVAPTPDGTIWFASGKVESWRGATYGLASYSGHTFLHVDPTSLGAIEYNVVELVAWPDGRLVLGMPNSGLLVWRPGDPRGNRFGISQGLPGQRIGRLHLDTMVDPPALYVPTEGGLAVLRSLL